jgi:hypothetical protein
MTGTERTPWYHYLLAGALLAVFLMQSFFASLQKSPVYDEPPHIASGLSYLATGVFRANLQHPPLLKELSALFLNAAGIHWPQSDDAKALTGGAPQGENAEWPIGNDIIASNGPDRVMFWARLPFILIAGLLGVLIYVWGRELAGNNAALGALFLYALDPTIVAHSYLVTTDVGLAAFSMLFFWTVWRHVNQPTRRGLAICGLAMGAMLGAKFSALFMVASAAVVLLAAIRWPISGASGVAPRVGPNSPCPCGSGKKYKRCHGATGKGAPGSQSRQMLKRAGAFLAMCAIAAIVIEALYFFPHDPLLYLKGLQKVNADHVAGYQYYFHGDTSTRFYGYFVAAYLLKEPLATIALVAVGLFVLLRSKSAPLLTKLFLLFPPAVFLLAMTIFADDMGVRYLIPAMPFAYLLGGMGLATLLASARAWTRSAAIALCLWLVVAAAGIYPDHLSYFNETACLLEKPGQTGWDGGSRCGPLWLDDSNVDWGQGLKQLRTWTNRHTDLPPVRLAYPATFPPEGYGLRFEKFLTRQLLTEPAPGWYAVSASLVGRMPAVGEKFEGGGAAWLRRMTPAEIVGHAFYIYQVR